MKIEDYMSKPYRMVIVPDDAEGGFTVFFPELPGCVTCVEDIRDAYDMAMDAKREWLAAAIEDGVIIDEPYTMQQVGLPLPDALRNRIVQKAASEGKSFSDFCIVELEKAVAV
ncbi:MAG: type II toxin-antitoxin system HicB family antitoxin [Lachnospiraceae bacterium]|nr:type II toxin-antitoxin system HicB family antitoxin [Lachnospiraceae bacterium]